MKRKRSVLQAILSPIATALNGFVGSGYNATDPRRKLIDRSNLYPNKASANTLLNGSLPQLRGYCRQLERNNPSARAGIEALTALVIGSGIDLAPETGDETKDKQIKDAFYDWLMHIGVDDCDIYRLQQLAMREVVVAGEFVWRVIPGQGEIPLRILPLESEWLSEQEGAAPSNGCTISAGIELDRYAQPVAYYLTPPEQGKPEKVPARDIIHGFEPRRPLQSRGEPWLAPVIETLMNERDLVDAELKAAVNTAAIGVVITSEAHGAVDTTEYGDTDDPVQSVALGSVVRLFPGEDIKSFAHTRPSQQISPFRQMLRGDLAAALRIPQRYLDRDVSRANYSSMRADMLDTDRLLSPVRELMGHLTVGKLYKIAAPYLSARLGYPVDPGKYRLLPDAQPYVDPVKDVQGAADAINAGLSTLEAEVSKRGGDYRQVQAQIAREKMSAAMANIDQIKAVQAAADASGVPGLTWAHLATLGGAATAPGAYLGAAMTPAPVDQVAEGVEAATSAAPAAQPEDDEEDDDEDEMEMEEVRHKRKLEIARASAPVFNLPAQPITIRNEIPAQAAPSIVVEVPDQPAPVVNVTTPAVTVEAARQEAPIVNVTVPQQAAPVVNVEVAPTPVTIENTVEVPQRTIIAKPGPGNTVIMTPQE